MPSLKRIAKSFHDVGRKASKSVNWHPGHMYSGMRAMIGKLSTVDCVIEVHDARIPFIGRNKEFREHLGVVKPHILVLNKRDLADLSQWDTVKGRLSENGDKNVILTDLSGNEFSHSERGFDKIMETAVGLIRGSDRHNRSCMNHFKVMIVGIPNVGKSTLINRLRQHHLGKGGEATRTGNTAGVTKHVENIIKICSRPLIYSLDTPGVLQPSATKHLRQSMILALCSTINDRALNSHDLASFLLRYLNDERNYSYVHAMDMSDRAESVTQLCDDVASKNYPAYHHKTPRGDTTSLVDTEKICWKFINMFRKGLYGKVMFL